MSWQHHDWHHERGGPEFIIGANLQQPLWQESFPPMDAQFYQPWNNPGGCFGNNYLDCPPIMPQQAFYSQPIMAEPYMPIIPRAHIGLGGHGFRFNLFI